MAQRRMFSPDIVCSDAFLDMPTSTQALYFQLGMKADDDGFVNPKSIMRLIGAKEDDLSVLLAKRFVLPFENGVLVIKHWRINNLVRKDWYKPTIYDEYKKRLNLKENGAYTDDLTKGNSLPIQTRYRLVNEPLTQVRLGKVNKTPEIGISVIPLTIEKAPKEDTESEPSSKREKIPSQLLEAYKSMVRWAEGEREFPFLKSKMTKQYAALKEAKENNIKAAQLKERWQEFAGDKFWSEKGFDWTNVVASFNKKI